VVLLCVLFVQNYNFFAPTLTHLHGSDIFGGTIPNCKFICDHFAKQGYRVAMPNFYAAQKIDAWDGAVPLGGDAFGAWFGSIMSDEFWTQYTKDLNTVAASLKAGGAEKVAVIGFCWGGKASVVAAAAGGIDAAASIHGAAHSADEVEKTPCPFLYISVSSARHHATSFLACVSDVVSCLCERAHKHSLRLCDDFIVLLA
jgi:dienelactone hydrolase